jgi:hypothetical protein
VNAKGGARIRSSRTQGATPTAVAHIAVTRALASRTVTHEKLWRYTQLSRIWARSLVAVGILVFCVGVAMQSGDSASAFINWIEVGLATVVPTTAVFFVLLRGWMRNGGLPSSRLVDATADPRTPRRLEATAQNWRVWTMMLVVGLLIAGVLIMGFLIGVLGGGGMAEGVVSGVLVAWGLVTAQDVRRVVQIEQDEHRRYFAACKRPVSVGSVLVWQETKVPETAG